MNTNQDCDVLFDELVQDLCDDSGFQSDGWLEKDSPYEDNDDNEILLQSALKLSDDFYRPLGMDNFGDDDDFDECDDEDEIEGKERKRKRSSNVTEAQLVAEATDENLKQLNIDPNSKEGKRQRRKIRNRMSAQLHRERKAKYIEMLEGIVRARNSKIIELQNSLRKIYLDNQRLKGQLHMLAPNLTDSSGDDTFINGTLPAMSLPVNAKKFTSPVTTDNSYESDTSGSNSSRCSSPTRPQSIYRTGISVFSFLMMLGVTFLSTDPSGPIGSGSLLQMPEIEFRGVSDSLPSHADFPSLPYLQLQQNSETIPGKYPALAHGTHTSSSVSGVGRVLLDRQLTVPSYISASPIINELPFPRIPPTIGESKTSTALWKYQDRVVQLFPHMRKPTSLGSGEGGGGEGPSVVTAATTSLRGARPRPRQSPTDAHSGTDLDAKKHALVVASSPYVWAGLDGDVDVDVDQLVGRTGTGTGTGTGVSHVLMTGGRALLDHRLIPSPALFKTETTPASVPSTTDATAGAVATALSPQPQFPYRPVGSETSPPPPPRLIAMDSTAFKTVRTGDASSSVAVPPVLVMLLPASSVRWGRSWDDAAQDPFADLIHDYETSNFSNQSDESSTGSGSDGVWVEIGCSVFRAQLVRNVSLS